MNGVISIIATLVLVGLLLWGVMKRMNAGFLLMVLGLGSIFVMELITHASVMGDKSIGNLFLDLFEYFQSVAASQLSRNVLIVMSVMGYVYYMEKLKASTMFALLMAKPFRNMKNPYLLIVVVLIFGTFLKLGITSASSLTAMMLATMYPIMRKAGLSRNTAAAVLPIAGSIVWGPADANWFMVFSVGNITELSVPEFFVKYMIVFVVLVVAVLSITLIIFSRYYDKKEGALANENDTYEEKEGETPESLGIPKFYALFPLLPLVIILVFSNLVKATPNVSVVGAHVLCFCFVMLVDMICKKNFKDTFNNATFFFEGMGRYFNLGGIIMISATIFSQGLAMIGGITKIADILSGGAGLVIGIAVATLLGMFIAAFSHLSPVIPIFVPLILTICTAAGVSPYYALCALIFGSCMGLNVYACNSAIIIASGATGAPISTILKRNLLPSLITAACCIVMGIILTH